MLRTSPLVCAPANVLPASLFLAPPAPPLPPRRPLHSAQGATVRLGSGSCIRLDTAEFCILLPQMVQGVPPVTGPPLPSLPGAGQPAPPSMLPVQVAAHILKSAAETKLSIGELEAEARRIYPHYATTNTTFEERESWRDALEAAMQQHPASFKSRPRAAAEPGAGSVWELNPIQ